MKKLLTTFLFLLAFNHISANHISKYDEILDSDINIHYLENNETMNTISFVKQYFFIYGESCIVQAIRNYHIMINSEIDLETAFDVSFDLLIICIQTGNHINLD